MSGEFLSQEIQKFLKKHHHPGKPVLLGFSGGPDSLALLYLLLERVDLHLAHLDHGWREESGKEALELKKMAEGRKIPFYMERIEGKPKGNLELYGREKRFEFFSKIYRQIGAQSLVLAHHADDQAETVLKRVLEGSSFLSLGGLKKKSSHSGMEIWRPLLGVTKKEILSWKSLPAIQDPTNYDPKYLRAKMRTQILPQMAEMFGKEVSQNLSLLGESAQKLKEYFEKKTDPYLEKIEGSMLDLAPFFPIEELELEVLIRRFSEKKNFFLSREMVALITDLLHKNAPKRIVGKLIINKRKIIIDD